MFELTQQQIRELAHIEQRGKQEAESFAPWIHKNYKYLIKRN
jgi:hypothetical protein